MIVVMQLALFCLL